MRTVLCIDVAVVTFVSDCVARGAKSAIFDFFVTSRDECVCLSVREDISGTTRAVFTSFFVRVAYVRDSVLLRHVYDRPHRLSPRRGFLSR